MKKLFLPLMLLCLAACSTEPKADYVADPASYVDPFIGTGGHGHTFPGATVPFGMVQFSPDTRMNPPTTPSSASAPPTSAAPAALTMATLGLCPLWAR